jgi:hypothetical protein
METFMKWGREKKRLDEIFDPLSMVGSAAGGAVLGLYTHNQKQRGKMKGEFWVYNKDAPEADRKFKATGIEIVQMMRTGDLSPDDFVWVVDAQNWLPIKSAKKYLPFHIVTKGKADKDTVWWAFVGGKVVKFPNSEAFAQAVAKREIEADTKVFRYGYDDWLPYKHQDVQDDIGQFVAQTEPTLGDTKFLGAKTYYQVNGRQYGPIKFEELVQKLKQDYINDESFVWVKGFRGREWVKFKEVKKLLPSLGQAHVRTERGLLSSVWKGAKRLAHKDWGRNKPGNQTDYLRHANMLHGDFKYKLDKDGVPAAGKEINSSAIGEEAWNWLWTELSDEDLKDKDILAVLLGNLLDIASKIGIEDFDLEDFKRFVKSPRGRNYIKRFKKELID